MDRQIRILFSVFAAVGLVMLLLASYFYSAERNFVKHGIRTEGTVSELDADRDSDGDLHYYPIVTFTTLQGQTVTFRSRTGSNPPAYEVGERIGVVYDPANPQGARHTGWFSLWGVTFIFTLLFTIFGGVGFVGLWSLRRAAARLEELRRFGRRLEAKVVSIEQNRNIHVNRRHPWRIVAEAEDPETHQTETYTSGNLWINPAGQVGETVTVFVDRQNPRRYCVDIEAHKAATPG